MLHNERSSCLCPKITAYLQWNKKQNYEQSLTKQLTYQLDNICNSQTSLIVDLTEYPASILYKSTAGRYRPVRVADGPIAARCRFIKNAYRVDTSGEFSTIVDKG